MKTILSLSGVLACFLLLQACDNADARYVDLNSGQTVKLKKDSASGLMVREEDGEPVDIYVDTETDDTIYGRTGKVINGSVRKENNGRYVFWDEDNDDDRNRSVQVNTNTGGSYKVKSGEYKKEVEKDGDITIKDGNVKIKIDGETGERKVKIDD